MKTIEMGTRRRWGRALPESGGVRSSRYGLSWAVGAFAALTLGGGVMVVSSWNHGRIAAPFSQAGGNSIVLTANTAPPALWSNAWLGRRPSRAVAFHGLRRLSGGLGIVTPHKDRNV
ncbi:MAG TPA: hypothetical protein VMV40_07145 [Acidiferrobacter sp.]|nr:hypothetical protein [Acidiferrobacter sp.]